MWIDLCEQIYSSTVKNHFKCNMLQIMLHPPAHSKCKSLAVFLSSLFSETRSDGQKKSAQIITIHSGSLPVILSSPAM